MTELRRRMLAATGGIQCGLRISEAAQIKLADIDCERRLIWVRAGNIVRRWGQSLMQDKVGG
jgi:integrase